MAARRVTDTDVLVAGGGPVGLASAIEARMRGLDVVVLEPRRAPVDKACGEGLMPGALERLHRLGVDPTGQDLTGIAYVSEAGRAEHHFRSGVGRGVRRTTLHQALHDRAVELGVSFRQDRVRRIDVGADRATACGVTARWLLGCDGLHSTVRRLAGVDRRARGVRRYGLRAHAQVAPWSTVVEVHWSPGCEAYVTPVGPTTVGVALLGRREGLSLQDQGLEGLRARLAGAELGPWRGAGPLRQVVTSPAAGPVRLVGDASGYVDALTGEGLNVGLAQARAVIETLEDGREYVRRWRAVTRDYRVLTSALVGWASSPARPLVVPAAVRLPRVFGYAVERVGR